MAQGSGQGEKGEAMDRRHQSQNLFRTKTNRPLDTFQRFCIFVYGLPAIFLAGCSMAPKSFLSMSDPAAINRARAVSFGRSEPDSAAIPVLIRRLTDDDPVVRLSSHEALKKRTGQDFGYLPYAEGDELNTSVSRWQQWWASGQNGRMFATSQPLASPQASAGLSPRQFKQAPKSLSEASYQEKRGLFKRLFRGQ